jgi:hypothetical protein
MDAWQTSSMFSAASDIREISRNVYSEQKNTRTEDKMLAVLSNWGNRQNARKEGFPVQPAKQETILLI